MPMKLYTDRNARILTQNIAKTVRRSASFT